MNLNEIVEAVLFAADKPLTVKQIQNVFAEIERPDSADIRHAVEEIKANYSNRPIQLQEVASGFRFQVRPELSPWVSRLFEERPPRYSRALLETLAIVAYRQPITRGAIEEIRGVAVSSNIIRTLLEREWVRIVGYKEVPGKPALYSTTKQFLDYFNLKSLNEMPALSELESADEAMNGGEEDESAENSTGAEESIPGDLVHDNENVEVLPMTDRAHEQEQPEDSVSPDITGESNDDGDLMERTDELDLAQDNEASDPVAVNEAIEETGISTPTGELETTESTDASREEAVDTEEASA